MASPISDRPRTLITGAASGIGQETALQLARLGHHVIVADRNAEGGQRVVASITGSGGSAEFRALDLADLGCVRAFAEDEVARGLPLQVLINNAGVLPPKDRATTRDGFELEFGIAHLGHFALTGLLLPALLRCERPRVVSLSSVSHVGGRIDLTDLQMERSYNSTRSYTTTKLACHLFASELHRRAQLAGSPLVSVAAHPGISLTPLAAGWEKENRRKLRERLELIAYHLSMRLFGQAASDGARSIVFAATDPSIIGGGYYGPTGFMQFGGQPGLVKPGKPALDAATAAGLWDASEKLTKVSFNRLRRA